MVPLFRGLGYSIVVICCVSELYYAVICGWSFFYLFAGMQSTLPWTNCADGEDWHTPNCYTRDLAESCRIDPNNATRTWYNGTCTDMNDYCKSHDYVNGMDEGTTNETVNYLCIDSNGNSTSK